MAEPAWKAAFTSRDCAAIGALGTADTARLYLGLRNACAAASDNDPTRWKAAKAALDATDSVFSCPDRLAQGLLARLVAAHERSPNARIRFGAPIVSPQDACR